uniref:Papain family cysteine protease n=1 Tax=Megaviridae environmental sample TaxID=1737588 RepID=A0A5J6VKH6_9VIRU|nr:MAG: papain family cysteine protease [Megaviridae environmental sample]
MFKTFITLLGLSSVLGCNKLNAINHRPLFEDFIEKYSKEYDSDEYNKRFEIFIDNVNYIREHNCNNHNYKLEINTYADLHAEEFDALFKSNLEQDFTCDDFSTSKAALNNSTLPTSIDWRDEGAVTPVKNQGSCGSCWAFSTSGAVEGAHAIAGNELVSLSEQQLVDCSHDGNMGCNGGLMDYGFEYVMDNGLCMEDTYKYIAKEGTCTLCKSIANISSCVDVTPSNQMHLMQAVALQPVSIAIEADTMVFQFYKNGIIDSKKCGTNLDHGVLVVGYGEEDGKKYWWVKNSWGDSWGESGYLRIERSEETDDDGICGVAMQPSYPVV